MSHGHEEAWRAMLARQLDCPGSKGLPMPPLPQIGHKVSFTRTVTDEDVVLFARVSGDDQPLHLDPAFGARTRFKKRIAHGMLSAAFISAALGTRLAPGFVVVYLGQQLRFRLPVGIGDTITAEVEVTAVDAEKRILTLRTDCLNQSGDAVVKGEASVLLDPLDS
jgi:3-hydroxybutyryl-CoA dehydratase